MQDFNSGKIKGLTSQQLDYQREKELIIESF